MDTRAPNPPTILIVSGGVGASGEQVVHTVLAQYPDSDVHVVTIPNIRFVSQIDDALSRAEALDAILVHTLVDPDLRNHMVSQAAGRHVVAIDLMGSLIEHLTAALGHEPLGQPGLYRQLNKDYFDRVAAIEFTMAHDDGQKPEGWSQAEIVLVGVSRVGKTPLSLYLSVLGWKVANVPLVLGLEPPQQLFQLDPRCVVGLKIEAAQLLAFRQQRQERLGIRGPSDYTNPEKAYEELQFAEKIFKRGGFATIKVTDKPIESSADEVVRVITRRMGKRD